MRLYRSLLRRYRPESFDHTRRAFLGLGVAAGALALTGPTNAALGLPSRTHHGRRVIIAGAGLAGLACAYELKRAGYDVQILEARPRIGGRVLTIRNWLPGKMVEAGGELIGSNHPMWLRYAHLFGLGFRPVTDWPEENRPILIDGRRLDDAAKRALFEDMDRILGALTRQSRGVDAEKPWLTLDAEALDRGSFGDWLALQRPEPLTEWVMQIELGADNGVSLAQQSLLGMMTQIKGGGLEKYWTDSEMLRCRQGNDALAAAFAGAVGGKRIHLQTQVKKIDITGNAVALVDVTGTRWQADHVVLAIPPSVWHAVAIQPALPATLFPQMGVNYKYLARIRKEVWAPASPEGLAEDSISETWNSVDNQSGPGLCLTGFTGGPP
ncbi:MAG: FAD-dependent oxidoreductase, partial [Rhodopila sp.]|nr:FAD-dependent oxidoreductase [Rhodopila sp.]